MGSAALNRGTEKVSPGQMLVQAPLRVSYLEQLLVPMELLITCFLHLCTEFWGPEDGWTRSPPAA